MKNRAAVAVAAGCLIGFTAAALMGAASAGDLNEDFPFTPTETTAPAIVQSDARDEVAPEEVGTSNPITVPSPIQATTPTQEPAASPAPEVCQEDEPCWDCRFDGNERCGVEIHGVWYVIQFRDGSPESVGYRGTGY